MFTGAGRIYFFYLVTNKYLQYKPTLPFLSFLLNMTTAISMIQFVSSPKRRIENQHIEPGSFFQTRPIIFVILMHFKIIS